MSSTTGFEASECVQMAGLHVNRNSLFPIANSVLEVTPASFIATVVASEVERVPARFGVCSECVVAIVVDLMSLVVVPTHAALPGGIVDIGATIVSVSIFASDNVFACASAFAVETLRIIVP